MRTLVIGDIHGGLKGLKQAINKVEPTNTDTFIFLGDYVDGWSDSLNTIEFLIDFSESYNCIFLRGNHDDLLLKYLINEEDNPMWLAHGGAITKANYEETTSETINKHISFLKKLTFYFVDEHKNLFVHAGFTNIKGPEFEYYQEMVYWDRSLWELANSLNPELTKDDEKFPNRLKLFNEIFIGHTPISKVEKCVPKKAASIWNMDTGAAYKGAVTIMDIKSKEYWQSEPIHLLYPSENGRN